MPTPEIGEAADPRTPAERLYALASERPELLGVIHANPACPQDLREWIELTDPKIAARARAEAEALRAETQRMMAEAARLYPSAPGGPAPSVGTVAGPPPTVGTAGQRPSTRPALLGPILVIIVAFLIFGAFMTMYQNISENSRGSTSRTTTTNRSSTDSSTPRDTWALPAPSISPSYALVDTPSKNISCELHKSYVACSILERWYAENGQDDCTDRLFSIAVDDGAPTLMCGEEYLGSVGDYVYEMQYGEIVVAPSGGEYACKAEESGVSCWNQRTGYGFKIQRSMYALDPNPGW